MVEKSRGEQGPRDTCGAHSSLPRYGHHAGVRCTPRARPGFHSGTYDIPRRRRAHLTDKESEAQGSHLSNLFIITMKNCTMPRKR